MAKRLVFVIGCLPFIACMTGSLATQPSRGEPETQPQDMPDLAACTVEQCLDMARSYVQEGSSLGETRQTTASATGGHYFNLAHRCFSMAEQKFDLNDSSVKESEAGMKIKAKLLAHRGWFEYQTLSDKTLGIRLIDESLKLNPDDAVTECMAAVIDLVEFRVTHDARRLKAAKDRIDNAIKLDSNLGNVYWYKEDIDALDKNYPAIIKDYVKFLQLPYDPEFAIYDNALIKSELESAKDFLKKSAPGILKVPDTTYP